VDAIQHDPNCYSILSKHVYQALIEYDVRVCNDSLVIGITIIVHILATNKNHSQCNWFDSHLLHKGSTTSKLQ